MHTFLTTAIVFTQVLGTPAPEPPQRAPEPAVRVLACAAEEVLPGTVRPRREVTLSSKFDAILAAVCIQEGQVIREGDVLAQLDDRVAQATVRLAQQEAARSAHLDRAKAVLKQAADVLTRVEAAAASSAAAKSELLEAKSRHAIALAEVRIAWEEQEQAALQLELAHARLDEHVIHAPFDAVAVRVRAEPGAMLSPGDPILELASVHDMCVDLHLPSALAAGLHPGERYALKVVDPSDLVTTARVRYVEPRIDPISRTMRVVFDLEASTSTIFAGALVRPADRLPEPAETRSESEQSAAAEPDREP